MLYICVGPWIPHLCLPVQSIRICLCEVRKRCDNWQSCYYAFNYALWLLSQEGIWPKIKHIAIAWESGVQSMAWPSVLCHMKLVLKSISNLPNVLFVLSRRLSFSLLVWLKCFLSNSFHHPHRPMQSISTGIPYYEPKTKPLTWIICTSSSQCFAF